MDEEGQLMTLGHVAAQNVARALELGEEHVAKIEQAIKDEMDAMSSHFVMTFADLHGDFEAEKKRLEESYARGLARIESVHNYVEQNFGVVLLWSGTVFLLGALAGQYI
jgi:hypothetical protein